MRINQPQLPHADPGNKWAADLTAQLQKTLLAVVTQLNALSDGGINAQTSAATAAPTTGVHAQGDFIRNSKPAASGAFGWVCVTSGTPGVWKTVSVGP